MDSMMERRENHDKGKALALKVMDSRYQTSRIQFKSTSKVLDAAEHEAYHRYKYSVMELLDLEFEVENLQYFRRLLSSFSNPPFWGASAAVEMIKSDIQMWDKLNAALAKYPNIHPALRSHKLGELFNCALEIIEANPLLVVSGRLSQIYPTLLNDRVVLGGSKDANGKVVSYFGSSKPNCIQTAYLTVLRVLTWEAKATLKEDGIYQPDQSANVQTTKLPDGFNSSAYREWFYYYSDEHSPSQGELLVPTLGYADGGSRADDRYREKQFRTEDSLSAVAKWLGAMQPFAAMDMQAVYDGDTSCAERDYCKAAQDVLDPVKDRIDNFVGLVFLFGEHTGVVSGQCETNNSSVMLIETISYTRDMYEIEGLGYLNYTLTKQKISIGAAAAIGNAEVYVFDVNGETLQGFFFAEKLPGQIMSDSTEL